VTDRDLGECGGLSAVGVFDYLVEQFAGLVTQLNTAKVVLLTG